MTHEEELSLAYSLAASDREAFAEVFRLFYPKVHTFCRRFTNDSEVSKDIAQDVFVKLWNSRKRLVKVQSLDNWIFIIARNSVLDWLKSASRRGVGLDSSREIRLEEGGQEDSVVDARIRLEQIREIVKMLPDKQRLVFVLSRYFGLSSADIAEQMGISRKTVENHLYTATTSIRKKIS